MYRRLIAALGVTVFLLGLGVFITPAKAQQANVTLCHATDSVQNPYEVITINQNGVISGHGGHTGPIFDPAVHNQQNRGWGDIIPAFDGFAGLNWPEGQSILENDCIVVTQIPDPDELFLTITKSWTGDDQSNAITTFTTDGVVFTGTPVEVEHGDTVVINETVENMPDNCEIISTSPEMPHNFVVDEGDANQEGLITLNVTNDVECEEEPISPPTPPAPPAPTDDGDVLGDRVVVRERGEVLGTQVSVVPTGGVQAGGGGAAGSALASLLGMGGSFAALGAGALRVRKQK